MLVENLKASLKALLMKPSGWERMELVWALCLANIVFITLLGAMLTYISGSIEFFIITLIITLSSGSLVILLLVKLHRLGSATKNIRLQAQAYDIVEKPLVILTPDLQFQFANKKAREECVWAKNFTHFKKSMITAHSKDALNRLIEDLYLKKGRKETLHIKTKKGEEVWRIESFAIGPKALWQCQNITFDASYLAQIKTLTLFMDHSAEGLFSLNAKGIILFCNDKFAKWLGYLREEIIGAPLSKFLVKPRGQDPIKLSEVHGKCDFITASSRIKSTFLEQSKIPFEDSFITYSLVHIHSPFASQSDLSKVLEMTPLPVICLDEDIKIRDSNILFRDGFWSEGPPLRETSFLDLVADFQKDEIKKTLQNYLKGTEDGTPVEIHFNDARDSIVSAYIAVLPVKNQKGLFIQFHDITEQKRFETQLAQSQKMQAVGQLAGGIAHDFNNLLTAMIGFCDLLLLRHTPGDQSFTDVMQIKQNANRAANLVRQLLAFSRQQTLQPKVLDITDSLAELSALLRRLMGANIELNMKHTRDLGLVLVDEGQFEQVIINMAVNARDAMESGGTITVTTQNAELKKAKRQGHDLIPAGSYVLVEITDTGTGIKPEIIDRIFDPFFSTKEVGSGTGLGLSTVYGIVKQTGGFIHVNSTVGEGTTFSIYLPRYTQEYKKVASSKKIETTQLQDLTGSSTILLVEDEDAVRLFSARALRSKGYTVLEAANGEDALTLMKETKEKIDLVISDVVMPNMDGPTFINEISQLTYNPKVLFISGYTEDTFHNLLKDDSKIQFLAKPFSLSDLATRVKQILGDEENQPSPILAKAIE